MTGWAGIHRFDLPTPYATRGVNAYLVEDDPLTLPGLGDDDLESLYQFACAKIRFLEDELARNLSLERPAPSRSRRPSYG